MPHGDLWLHSSASHLIMPLLAVELTLSPGSLAQGDVHLLTTRLWLFAKIY